MCSPRCVQVSKEEKSNYSEQLLAAYQGFKNETEKQNAFKSDTFYKVGRRVIRKRRALMGV